MSEMLRNRQKRCLWNTQNVDNINPFRGRLSLEWEEYFIIFNFSWLLDRSCHTGRIWLLWASFLFFFMVALPPENSSHFSRPPLASKYNPRRQAPPSDLVPGMPSAPPSPLPQSSARFQPGDHHAAGQPTGFNLHLPTDCEQLKGRSCDWNIGVQ